MAEELLIALLKGGELVIDFGATVVEKLRSWRDDESGR
jgi:hypothetical protein